MKDLIERVVAFNTPASSEDVENTIKYLGETPSMNTINAVVDFYKAELKQILTKDLLEWMMEHDQVNFETEELKVSVQTHISAKMVDPERGFNWLIEQDPENKNMFKEKLEFPKGELTEEAEKMLADLGLSYVKKSGIAPPTLKRLMKGMLERGEMLPDEEEDGIKIGYYDECVVKEK